MVERMWLLRYWDGGGTIIVGTKDGGGTIIVGTKYCPKWLRIC